MLTLKPCIEQALDPIVKEVGNLYPACAVSGAMNKIQTGKESTNVDLADMFISPFRKLLSEYLLQKSHQEEVSWII